MSDAKKEAPSPSHEEPGAKPALGTGREDRMKPREQAELVRLYMRIAKDFDDMARAMVDAASRVR